MSDGRHNQNVCEAWLAEIRLNDGHVVCFRHVRPADYELLADAFGMASEKTLLHRFFSPIRRLSADQLRKLVEINPDRETCVVGLLSGQDGGRIVCGARLALLERPGSAEIAVTVHDNLRRRGLGTFLLKLLFAEGSLLGVHSFEAVVMNENIEMLNLLQKIAPNGVCTSESEGVSRIVIDRGQQVSGI